MYWLTTQIHLLYVLHNATLNISRVIKTWKVLMMVKAEYTRVYCNLGIDIQCDIMCQARFLRFHSKTQLCRTDQWSLWWHWILCVKNKVWNSLHHITSQLAEKRIYCNGVNKPIPKNFLHWWRRLALMLSLQIVLMTAL